ncbi:hypothetical protein BG006_003658 [Podila minutissima]|uniref:Sterol regulatory element-binding protein cleavage-activating protein n=1 Tax=Podila minutissima TaxID=64525 RepID=A0A9P5VMS8_9FUNG|nr:hypothetical protein BG006_003658 [Podila minutissima]
MSALSRIPGLASLGALVASAFSLHHPTIRRYNDLLASAFYHHGRLCASNQATVMVLVIIFVGIISYPGIITSYNSSSYARMPTPPSLSSSRANLEAFWADVITPTWTQDTDLIGAQVSSGPPLHYVAPVIINASSIMHQERQDDTPFSETDLLIFAAHVHQRIESIVVDYNAPDHREGQQERAWTPRYLSLKDICLQDKESTARCLVQSPLVHWTSSDHLETDDDLDHILRLHNSSMASVKSSLFGRIAAAVTNGDHLDSQQQQGQHGLQPATASSLAITFFLRGDSEISNYPKGVNVERAWKLIFDRLLHEWDDPSLWASLPDDDRGEDYPEGARVNHSPPTAPSSRLADLSIDISSDIGKAHAGSRRLVSEEYAKPRSNISAEYWLLGMAYFVMFLYISLSVGRVDLVKSKYGLGIAAVATVFVSLLMSIGLCSVFGVTLTLMPWEILPFMIIVVGVENINILVHAVVETSMDLPVKERVGRGLGAVGVSITMTLIAELCLLIVGAMTTIPAVQEFCTFAIAAVIMDYLLQMSFFITVISIDIRRLELSDLSSRPVAPLLRYPFSRHGLHSTLAHGSRAGPLSTTTDAKFKHQRSDSSVSNHSEGESKSTGKPKPSPKGRIFTSIIMVGVMTYLGYIYGTTSQATQSTNVAVSFWHIQSSEFASEFWNLMDASNNGGYLEIYQPMVLTVTPFSSTSSKDCIDLQEDECSDPDAVHQDELDQRGKAAKLTNRQLDPKRPFKILRDTLLIACLFVFWLVRVFVIPSIVLAAAILLLLSYLLSPQRKLLVDLQWSFPFIVLPGDYQSKRKIMMEELLAQEARELGRDPGPSIPLPGTVDTLKMGGHETDIDQMDVTPNGLVLTSSMDGIILLWSSDEDGQVPIAQLESGPRTESMPTNPSRAPGRGSLSTSSSHRPINKSVRCLQLDPSGNYAAAGYSDGSIRFWRIDTLKAERDTKWRGQALSLSPMYHFDRADDTDPAKLRVSSIHFWPSKSGLSLIAGYRDGQVWSWNPLNGSGHFLVQSKHRGGIAELEVVELEQHTRYELGLQQKTYLVTAGKDGTIQCWSSPGDLSMSANWTSLWQQPSLGPGISVSVLSKDNEVPMISTGYSNGAIRIWDIEHGSLVWTLSRGTLVSGPQAGYSQSDRRHSATALDHQPSHQGAVTKLSFKALELEDGLTGEPAPRVWLVISSGMDETVMVWMVEWEGLMSLPPTQEFDPQGTSPQSRAPLKRSMSQRELSHPMFHGRGAEPVDTLSSSLPAPRLVGFAKQRGGKSMAVGSTCLYGVRRRESPLAVMSSAVPKQPHTSVSDFAGSTAARNRRKSAQLTSLPNTSSSSSNGKRGWEVWEADLYQCIFKDPGVWGLDLSVRSIDLQAALPTTSGYQDAFYARRGSYFALNRCSSEYEPFRTETRNSADAVMVNSNGSGMAVPVSPSLDPHHPEQLKTWSQSQSNIPKPQLRRRPGSSSSHGGQQGYVYTSGYPQQYPPTPGSEFSQFLFPTGSGRPDGSPWDPMQENTGREIEHELLPFVETRHIHVILPHQIDGKGVELSNIVVGFGNWIKIVRVQNDEEEEEEENEGLDVYDYEG